MSVEKEKGVIRLILPFFDENKNLYKMYYPDDISGTIKLKNKLEESEEKKVFNVSYGDQDEMILIVIKKSDGLTGYMEQKKYKLEKKWVSTIDPYKYKEVDTLHVWMSVCGKYFLYLKRKTGKLLTEYIDKLDEKGFQHKFLPLLRKFINFISDVHVKNIAICNIEIEYLRISDDENSIILEVNNKTFLLNENSGNVYKVDWRKVIYILYHLMKYKKYTQKYLIKLYYILKEVTREVPIEYIDKETLIVNVLKYLKNWKEKDAKCNKCLEELGKKENVTVENCENVYHTECLLKNKAFSNEEEEKVKNTCVHYY